jgi:hypothetical protein
MLARGYWLGAVGVLALAKMVSLGVTAFIFDLTRPKLLELAWFRWLYEHMLVWLDWAHGLIDPIKKRIKTWFRVFSPKRAGRTLKLLLRIRRSMKARAAAA